MAAVGFMARLAREMGYENLYSDLQHLKPQVIRMIEDRIEAEGGIIKKVEIKNNGARKVFSNNRK